MTVMLGLSLTCDQCHGFENLNLRELCRNLPSSDDTTTNTAKNCPSMGSSAYGTFSCKCKFYYETRIYLFKPYTVFYSKLPLSGCCLHCTVGNLQGVN